MKTLFEKIIDGELPSEKLYEDERVIAIKDIAPKAPIHVLIIPKQVITGIQAMEPAEFPMLGDLVRVAQHLARELGIEESGYRLVLNQGPDAGQTIFHLHMHLLAGAPMERMA